MNNDERKPRLHIHTGGIIILIIILLVLFKVDIKSKIKSPQFQKNIAYIEVTIKDFYKKNISDPLKIKTKDFFIKKTNEGLEKWQNNFSENVLKIPTEEEIENNLN
jgi:hypothetical protein